MTISLTIFDSIYDNSTSKRVDYKDFDQFEQILYKLANEKTFKQKKDAPLISPATYVENSKRANANVVAWGGFGIVDVDDYVGDIEDIHKQYEDYRYVCYSTASSTKENPKFRLVFPLTKWVESEQIKHFWYALNKEIGDIADAQTKDLSRMYYIPATYNGAYNFIFSHDGKVMNPDELMEKHRYISTNDSFFDRLPEAIRNGLIEHRKQQLNNTDFSWSGYRDCPFVNKRQVEEYKQLSGTGWYYKMYQIMISIASNAMKRGYPITAQEIAYICRDLDNDTGGWYGKRDLTKEADRAIEYIFRSNI
tara:strand:+ start:3748 stop:4668 length:921 start_codon:yes stop_codon:yes gene_type:complete